MEIRLNDKRALVAANAVDRTNSKVNSAFAKFGYKVQRVDLYVDDVNGPKGGIDKECRVVVKLKKMEDVFVTAKDESLSKAISQAIKRAARTVARQIQKRSIRDGDRHSNFSFAVYG